MRGCLVGAARVDETISGGGGRIRQYDGALIDGILANIEIVRNSIERPADRKISDYIVTLLRTRITDVLSVMAEAEFPEKAAEDTLNKLAFRMTENYFRDHVYEVDLSLTLLDLSQNIEALHSMGYSGANTANTVLRLVDKSRSSEVFNMHLNAHVAFMASLSKEMPGWKDRLSEDEITALYNTVIKKFQDIKEEEGKKECRILKANEFEYNWVYNAARIMKACAESGQYGQHEAQMLIGGCMDLVQQDFIEFSNTLSRCISSKMCFLDARLLIENLGAQAMVHSAQPREDRPDHHFWWSEVRVAVYWAAESLFMAGVKVADINRLFEELGREPYVYKLLGPIKNSAETLQNLLNDEKEGNDLSQTERIMKVAGSLIDTVLIALKAGDQAWKRVSLLSEMIKSEMLTSFGVDFKDCETGKKFYPLTDLSGEALDQLIDYEGKVLRGDKVKSKDGDRPYLALTIKAINEAFTEDRKRQEREKKQDSFSSRVIWIK
jgi:hypothetical protein